MSMYLNPDGNITIYKVEYYNGRHKIGENFQAPYSLNWHNTAGGVLKLTARVIDHYGMVGKTDTLVINSIINDISYTENHDFSIKAYPNPFSSETAIEYSLKNNCHLSLEIYDMLGKKIKSLQMGYHKAGSYRFIWDGTDANHIPVSPGAFVCKFENSDTPDGDINSKNILLLKIP